MAEAFDVRHAPMSLPLSGLVPRYSYIVEKLFVLLGWKGIVLLISPMLQGLRINDESNILFALITVRKNLQLPVCGIVEFTEFDRRTARCTGK